ncbi:hypothetical protein K9M79_04200 [Candidatus Woesearchaeota archaeon]|nr:hypothetical protein [Candidatus Woesearchaeota archaeon]
MTKNSNSKQAKKSDVSNEEIKKLRKWFKEEIDRRDKIIARLREENNILMKTSLKQADKYIDLQEDMQKLLDK